MLATVIVVAVVFVAVVDPAFVAGMPVREIVRRTFGVVVFGVVWVAYHLGVVELRAYEEADGEWAELGPRMAWLTVRVVVLALSLRGIWSWAFPV